MEINDYSPIKLRQKVLKDGRRSLYLDYYNKGKRVYEFLRLYLLVEDSKEAKTANIKTMQLATKVLNKKISDLERGKWGYLINDNIKSKTPLIDIIKILCNNKERMTISLYFSVYKKFCLAINNDNPTIECLTKENYLLFQKFLEKSELKRNTIVTFLTILRIAYNYAYKNDYLLESPIKNVKKLSPIHDKRAFLTIEEVKLLINNCDYNNHTHIAFLFSCLCGLRFSDISLLTWGQIEEFNNYTRISLVQKKTKELIYVDLPQTALQFLPKEKGQDDDLVFKCGTQVNVFRHIKNWIKKVGIKKNVSFHTARHTFAVLMLSNGVELFTLKNLMGHKNINTTLIYSDIVDSKRHEAVSTLDTALKGNE